MGIGPSELFLYVFNLYYPHHGRIAMRVKELQKFSELIDKLIDELVEKTS
jgi:hypothetical protein